ncbi:hypothetical protein PR048_030253 [Dryococelus australis]|uniref:Uncharacterized protein n=1 Tax=Dryococelus australis TaxID=614101 RepID=A0ABQ9G8G8_9NEOP|nr:hypothetical protein PR048_030253 [Dryococelus australis]
MAAILKVRARRSRKLFKSDIHCLHYAWFTCTPITPNRQSGKLEQPIRSRLRFQRESRCNRGWLLIGCSSFPLCLFDMIDLNYISRPTPPRPCWQVAERRGGGNEMKPLARENKRNPESQGNAAGRWGRVCSPGLRRTLAREGGKGEGGCHRHLIRKPGSARRSVSADDEEQGRSSVCYEHRGKKICTCDCRVRVVERQLQYWSSDALFRTPRRQTTTDRCTGGVLRTPERPGATVSERLDYSPPTKANRFRSPAGSLDFRKWESCRTMPLVSRFSRGSSVSPVLSFLRLSILTSITLIGSEDLDWPSLRSEVLRAHSQLSASLEKRLSPRHDPPCRREQLSLTYLRAGMQGKRETPEKTRGPKTYSHDSHLRKSGSHPAVCSTRFTLVGGEQTNRSDIADPGVVALRTRDRRNAMAVEKGDPGENPLASGIVRHDFHPTGSPRDFTQRRYIVSIWSGCREAESKGAYRTVQGRRQCSARRSEVRRREITALELRARVNTRARSRGREAPWNYLSVAEPQRPPPLFFLTLTLSLSLSLALSPTPGRGHALNIAEGISVQPTGPTNSGQPITARCLMPEAARWKYGLAPNCWPTVSGLRWLDVVTMADLQRHYVQK